MTTFSEEAKSLRPELNKLAHATMQALAKQALVQLGYKPAQARAAIDRAGPCSSLEALIREALRRSS